MLTVVQEAEVGIFDKILDRVLVSLPSQLFGQIADERDASVFAGLREGRKSRAFDTYELLARGITFREKLATLLALVHICTRVFPLQSMIINSEYRAHWPLYKF